MLAAFLRAQGWKGSYTGVDVSSEALRLASQRNLPSCQWVNSDFGSFSGSVGYDAIVMIESLYYLSANEARALLHRLPSLLASEGSIVIRIHDPHRHKGHVAVVEEVLPTARKFVISTG